MVLGTLFTLTAKSKCACGTLLFMLKSQTSLVLMHHCGINI